MLADPTCTGRKMLARITGKWGLLVLVGLSDEERRFFELSRAVAGISDKMLSQTLRDLATEGLILRDADESVPPKVSYRLSVSGQRVVGHVRALIDAVAVSVAER